MKISTKGRYGARAMIEIASANNEKPTTLLEISHNQEISKKYLHFILTRLKTAGLIKTVKGRTGGYLLAKKASEITLRDILIALEGELKVVDCIKKKQLCHRHKNCATRQIWQKLEKNIFDCLSNITLEQMLNDNLRVISKPQKS
ncbi:MAG: Rrf2 family transcriptional regulator [Pseudomonadota bacterium]